MIALMGSFPYSTWDREILFGNNSTARPLGVMHCSYTIPTSNMVVKVDQEALKRAARREMKQYVAGVHRKRFNTRPVPRHQVQRPAVQRKALMIFPAFGGS